MSRPCIYVIEDRIDITKYETRLTIYKFNSLRIARKFYKIRFEELGYSTCVDVDWINESGESLVLDSPEISENCATLSTKDRNGFPINYSISIIEDLVDNKGSSKKYRRLSILPFEPIIPMTEWDVDERNRKLSQMKRTVVGILFINGAREASILNNVFREE